MYRLESKSHFLRPRPPGSLAQWEAAPGRLLRLRPGCRSVPQSGRRRVPHRGGQGVAQGSGSPRLKGASGKQVSAPGAAGALGSCLRWPGACRTAPGDWCGCRYGPRPSPRPRPQPPAPFHLAPYFGCPARSARCPEALSASCMARSPREGRVLWPELCSSHLRVRPDRCSGG